MYRAFTFALASSAAQAASTAYISGQVTSTEKFLYGKFRAQVTCPGTKGSTVGFFTQWTGPDYDFFKWNSIEMEIVPSLDPTPLSLDLSYGDGTQRLQAQNYDPNFQPGVYTPHVYEFTWTPNEVSFIADGQVLKQYFKGDPYVDQQTKPQNILFNMWSPASFAHTEDWSAGRDDSTMPWYAMADWIEYHSWDENTDTFNFSWRDDFDTLDYSKWTPAHEFTFNENLSTYMHDQVYIDKGQLVLQLKKNENRTNSW